MIIIVMGVSGSGKTTIGRMLADRLGAGFSDADEFHSPANKAKMAAGTPLNHDDRAGWLAAIAAAMAASRKRNETRVFTSSALKRAYRDRLRQGAPHAVFVYLSVPQAVLEERLKTRKNHFFDPALLQDQLDTLEEPDPSEALVIDGTPKPDAIVAAICAALAARGPDGLNPRA